MNRAAVKILQSLLAIVFLLMLSESAAASHYRFWLSGKIRFPYFVYQGDTTGGSDCWGWTSPDGTEYAIMGVRDGIAIVNAHTMQVKATVPGPATSPLSYFWRDVETYQHYAYAVSELTGTNQGLSVIDLQYLPDSVHYVGSFPLNLSGAVTAHTIAIDTLKGFAYCERNGSLGQPIVILSLANPENPTFVGSFGPTTGQSIHDMFARNDTAFVAEGWNSMSQGSWSVWNCANKASPSLITRVFFPGAGYVHSTWPTEDRSLLLTTEEIPAGKTMKVWDIADFGNIDMRGQYIGAAQIPHNVYPKGNLVFVSHYEAGVTVVDISNPDAPMEIARYDTYPASDSAEYRGCWSAYPYTANGFVYASNLDGWLFVLRFGQNSAPAIGPFGPINAPEGDITDVLFTAADPDSGDVPNWSVTGQPSWVGLSENGNQATLTFTPGFSDSGVYSFSLIATDGFDVDTALVTVHVTNTNRAPLLTPIPSDTMRGGETLGVAISASDPDAGPITLSALGLKPHISLVDSGNGKVSLTFAPGRFYSNTDTVRIIASDGSLADTTLAIVTIRGQAKGDFNFDLMLTPADVVLGLNCIFQGIGDCPLEVADSNCDSTLSPADVVLLLNAVFSSQLFPC
ncbi:MAG: choice-of-anchor B family protein [Limisphaerales bacterium]